MNHTPPWTPSRSCRAVNSSPYPMHCSGDLISPSARSRTSSPLILPVWTGTSVRFDIYPPTRVRHPGVPTENELASSCSTGGKETSSRWRIVRGCSPRSSGIEFCREHSQAASTSMIPAGTGRATPSTPPERSARPSGSEGSTSLRTSTKWCTTSRCDDATGGGPWRRPGQDPCSRIGWRRARSRWRLPAERR